MRRRVIPCLLLADGGLVKTRRFGERKYVGDPINAIRIFNEKEVDELVVLDIDASRSGKAPDFALIEQFAAECFMPLCYGGGIRTLADAQRLFELGIEKVCLQSAALLAPSLLQEIASRYGSQSLVVSVDVKRDWRKRPMLYHAAASRKLPQSAIEFVRGAVERGAGEVLLNAVDRDGMQQGFDLELVAEMAAAVEVPLVAVGGAGSLDDLRKVVDAGASAVAAGSLFVFHGPHRAVLISYPGYAALARVFGE
jgi:imidazole glycerol-phosphate synthase subunit HisF